MLGPPRPRLTEPPTPKLRDIRIPKLMFTPSQGDPSPQAARGENHTNGLSGTRRDSYGDVTDPQTLCQAHMLIRIRGGGEVSRTENLVQNGLNQKVLAHKSLELSVFRFSLRKAQMSLDPVSLLPPLSTASLGRANSWVGPPREALAGTFSALPALWEEGAFSLQLKQNS